MSIKNPEVIKMHSTNEHSFKTSVILHDRSVNLNNISPLIKHFCKILGKVSRYTDFDDVGRNHTKAYQFACSHDLFGFKDAQALMDMIKPIIEMDGDIQNQRRWRKVELNDVVKKDLVGSVETAYERYKKIASRKWIISFGHTHAHDKAYTRLIKNVSPSKFEFECGGFYDKIVYMTGLWSVVKKHGIQKVDNKVIVYAKLISENEHGLKVFKAKWIRPTNNHPKFVNESGYIFSYEEHNITAAKNVKAEQRIGTVAQRSMTEQFGKTAMTRVNDLAGKPVPYYLYETIMDYIIKEMNVGHGNSTLDVISHFRFTVFMTSVMNQIKVTKEASDAVAAAAEAVVAADIKVEVDKAVKESIEAAGLTDLIDKINASKDKAA